ncbi:Cell wall synthesis protein kre9 precursor [Savitreella phatthalungensis]
MKLLRLFALVGAAVADVLLTSPAAGSSLAGGSITLQWTDSGALPALSSLKNADIVLCTGTNTNIQTLLTVAGAVALNTRTSLTVTIPPTIGTTGQYFLKFISTTTSGLVVTTFSSRFTLTGMTGTLVANTGLSNGGPAGTTPAGATASATTTLATSGLGMYASQTGLTRVAPPQRKVGTAITANPATAQPMYPTSTYAPYLAVAPTPAVMTTLTASQTWAYTSYENGAPAAQFVASAHL